MLPTKKSLALKAVCAVYMFSSCNTAERGVNPAQGSLAFELTVTIRILLAPLDRLICFLCPLSAFIYPTLKCYYRRVADPDAGIATYLLSLMHLLPELSQSP